MVLVDVFVVPGLGRVCYLMNSKGILVDSMMVPLIVSIIPLQDVQTSLDISKNVSITVSLIQMICICEVYGSRCRYLGTACAKTR